LAKVRKSKGCTNNKNQRYLYQFNVHTVNIFYAKNGAVRSRLKVNRMKYTTHIDIDLPRDKVIHKMDNPDNMKHWQKGLQTYKILRGTPGQPGAQMELNYIMGKREMTLIETIITNDFPHAIHASYDTKGVHNIQKNFFDELDTDKTRWRSESEFKFNSFGMKVMGFLLPGMFKKQSKKYMEDFKNFAENGVSVTEKE